MKCDGLSPEAVIASLRKPSPKSLHHAETLASRLRTPKANVQLLWLAFLEEASQKRLQVNRKIDPLSRLITSYVAKDLVAVLWRNQLDVGVQLKLDKSNE